MPYYVSPPFLSDVVRVRTAIAWDRGLIYETEVLDVLVIFSVILV